MVPQTLQLNRSQTANMFIYLLESDNVGIKIAFVLIVMVMFMIIFRLSLLIIGYIFEVDGDQYVFKGLKNANKKVTISQDPNLPNNVIIKRSNNESEGIEFTWSVWLFLNNTYLDGLDEGNKKYLHVFHKGSINKNEDGRFYPNNCPGVYLDSTMNKMYIYMNTFNNIEQKIEIENLPTNKWFHLSIVVEHDVIDVYMNGFVMKRISMKGVNVIKQNYDNIYINHNGGFNGMLSNLLYYDHAITISEINSIIKKGPNLKMDEKLINKTFPKYLSQNWFLNNKSATG